MVGGCRHYILNGRGLDDTARSYGYGGSEARDKSVGKYMGACPLHVVCHKSTACVGRVIGALVLNVQLKAKTYESTILSAIFSINNLHFIQETYRKR